MNHKLCRFWYRLTRIPLTQPFSINAQQRIDESERSLRHCRWPSKERASVRRNAKGNKILLKIRNKNNKLTFTLNTLTEITGTSNLIGIGQNNYALSNIHITSTQCDRNQSCHQKSPVARANCNTSLSKVSLQTTKPTTHSVLTSLLRQKDIVADQMLLNHTAA